MNDQQQPYDPYDPYYAQPRIVGYDEYGQPVYEQPQTQQYDAYGQPQQPQHQQQAQPRQTYDPYAQPQAPQPYENYGQQHPQPPPQQQDGYGYDAYGYDTGQQQAQQPVAVDATQQWIPQQQEPQQEPQQESPQRPRQAAPAAGQAAVPEQRRPAVDEQFAFTEEPDEDSEDVIDWLKFTESRSERREEAKRRGRSRVVALVVAVVLVVAGGAGYLWYAGKLPGSAGADTKGSTAAGGAQKRDVIVVHLHNTKAKGTSTALLVNNATTGQGTTVLLPNSLSVEGDDGSGVTLGKSVDDDGSDTTRKALGTLLGTEISGTWRLDTPYLDNLVQLVGNIDLTTDTDVPGAKKGDQPVVRKGENQTLSGKAAVAYATYRGPGEPEAKQLQRFGQVLQGVLRKMSDDPKAATVTVQTLGQILDPSLTEADLGAALAKLSLHAKEGDYKTALLPVQPDGTLSDSAVAGVVKDILGGSVSAPEKGSALRVGVEDASGGTSAAEAARTAVINGGYSYVDGGSADAEASSQVIYGDAAIKEQAVEVAKTLGLPTDAVKKGTPAANADVSVVLGQDYSPN
ncbi:LCP family protein [Streptomyces sp. NBC_01317]|uniref:LCP family protein n=1 Tax=Streptomyces sp. NBC_01317 TaxID=2903822 RepID=UPI002E132D5B|nr:LCP family protein [Streptomyces sp. NBC_01317]